MILSVNLSFNNQPITQHFNIDKKNLDDALDELFDLLNEKYPGHIVHDVFKVK